MMILKPETLALVAEHERLMELIATGKTTTIEALTMLGLSPNIVKLPDQTMVVNFIRAAIERADNKLSLAVAKEMGLLGLKARGKDASGVFRLIKTLKHFPNLEAGLEVVKAAIDEHGMAVLSPHEFRDSLELEMLQNMFPAKVRLALTHLPTPETPNCELPDTWLTMGMVERDDVLAMVRTLKGSVTDSGKAFMIWGLKVDVHDHGYTINRRAEVRSSLIMTRRGSQMIDAHQAMFMLLVAADAGLTRRIANTGASKNMWDKIAQGWVLVSMASMMKFEGTYYVDGVRDLVETGKFQPMSFGFGVYGPEVDTRFKLDKAETWARIYKACPESIAEPQGKYFLKAETVLDLIRTKDDLLALGAEDILDDEEFEALCKRLDDGELLAAVASTCPTKWLKRCLLNKTAAVDTLRKDVSPVLFKGKKSVGPALDLVVAPTLLPIFTGGLGAITSLVTRGIIAQLLAGKTEATISGTSAGIPDEAALERIRKSLPEVGTELKKGMEFHVYGMPVPIKVDRKKRGRVAEVIVLPGAYQTANWEIRISTDDNYGEAKLRGLMKGTLNFAGDTLVSPSLKYETELLRHFNLAVFGIDAGHILCGMDAIKMTGKGSAEFIVNLAAFTLKVLWGAEWADKVLELVPDHVVKIVGNELFIEYSPLADYLKAYDKLVKAFEEVAGRDIEVSRTLPKQDWLDLAELYEADLDAMDSFTSSGITFKGVGVAMGQGMMSTPDTLSFVVFEGASETGEDVYAIVQKTRAFVGSDVVKVESTPISKSISVVGSMLEVAHAAKATGQLDMFASWMEVEGRKRASKLEHLLRMMTIRPDAKGEPTIAVAGAIRTSVKDLGTHGWDRVEVITRQTLEVFKKDKAKVDEILAEFVGKDIDLWDEKALFVIEDKNGRWVGFDKAVLSSFGRGTDEGGMLQTVRNLLAYACEGNLDGMSGMAIKLRMTMGRMTEGAGIFKWLHRGADAVYAKRTAVFALHAEDHKKLFVHPRGEAAHRLKKLFGVEHVKDLVGKKVAHYRGPQFLIEGLEIALDTRVGRHELGVTDRVASKDQGDFDGDGICVIALTDEDVAAEVMAFNAAAYALKVHALGTTAAPHWIEANTFDESKASWSRPSIKSMKEIHELGYMAIVHQTQDMPSDSNRAHLRLVESSLNLPSGYTATIEEAQGLMFYVYETQLAGPNWKWRELHTILEGDAPYATKKANFINFAKDPSNKLGLTEHMAEVMFESVFDHQAYTSMEKTRSKRVFTDEQGRLTVKQYVRATATPEERYRLPLILLAAATKRLAQGRCSVTNFSRILRNLDTLRVKNYVRTVDENEVPKETEFLKENGKTEVISLMQMIKDGVSKGNPACIRLAYFVDRILPLMEVLLTSNKPVEDFDSFDGWEVAEGSENGGGGDFDGGDEFEAAADD